MAERTYLDWNATAPLRPEAREKVAALVGAEPRNVIFTSGGTEANMLALTPSIEHSPDKIHFDRLIISAIEHASVRTGGRFPAGQVEEFAVTEDGAIDLVALERRLSELKWQGKLAPLVSVMVANNETG